MILPAPLNAPQTARTMAKHAIMAVLLHAAILADR